MWRDAWGVGCVPKPRLELFDLLKELGALLFFILQIRLGGLYFRLPLGAAETRSPRVNACCDNLRHPGHSILLAGVMGIQPVGLRDGDHGFRIPFIFLQAQVPPLKEDCQFFGRAERFQELAPRDFIFRNRERPFHVEFVLVGLDAPAGSLDIESFTIAFPPQKEVTFAGNDF